MMNFCNKNNSCIEEYPQLEIFRDYIEDYRGNIDSYFYSKLSDLLLYEEYRDEPLVFNIFTDKEDSYDIILDK